MERTGVVTAVSDDVIEITFCRPSDCEKCHACIGGEKQHVIRVKGQANIGDQAVVSLPESSIVKASALAYLFPVAGLFAGMLLGTLIAPDREMIASAVGGVIGLAIPLFILVLTEKRRKQSGRYDPQLVRVIPLKEAIADSAPTA